MLVEACAVMFWLHVGELCFGDIAVGREPLRMPPNRRNDGTRIGLKLKLFLVYESDVIGWAW